MWLVPHFIALDIAGVAVQLFQSRSVVSVYQPQRNAAFDAAILRGRQRFGKGVRLYSRFESARAVMRAVRDGYGFFNLPDMDFGERDAAFVPFFGVPAATLLAPSRLARALDMVVQPVVAELLPRGQGYRVRFLEPLADFPSDDAYADTVRMNHWIEQEVRRCPSSTCGCTSASRRGRRASRRCTEQRAQRAAAQAHIAQRCEVGAADGRGHNRRLRRRLMSHSDVKSAQPTAEAIIGTCDCASPRCMARAMTS